MLPRLSSCAVTPPPHRPPTITPLTCVMIQSGAIRRGWQPGQQGQPSRSAARQPAPSPAASRQLPASSLQAVNRQPSTVNRQPSALPITRATRTPRQSLRAFQPTANPSGSLQASTGPAALLPSDAGAKPARTKPKTRHPPPQKLSTSLLITC